MAEELQSSFPTQFLQQLLSSDSPFLYLRTNSSARVLYHNYNLTTPTMKLMIHNNFDDIVG